jgi:hypothetical protein
VAPALRVTQTQTPIRRSGTVFEDEKRGIREICRRMCEIPVL